MPVISMFYGITISLYFLDNRRHHRPHIHARFQGEEAVVSIPEGELLEDSLPPGKMKMVVAWVEIHRRSWWRIGSLQWPVSNRLGSNH